jgi:hypothetical protein
MSYRIRCTTLFDITRTGISNRKPPTNCTAEFLTEWEKKRNTQCNYDTIIQVLSLRSQPEDLSEPLMKDVVFADSTMFGFLFEGEEVQSCWEFDFTINHAHVFFDGIDELGFLYSDCEAVPMIKVTTQWDKLSTTLDVSPELRNIHFEVISND